MRTIPVSIAFDLRLAERLAMKKIALYAVDAKLVIMNEGSITEFLQAQGLNGTQALVAKQRFDAWLRHGGRPTPFYVQSF